MSRYQPIIPKINNPEIRLPDELAENFLLALKSASVSEVESLIRTTNIRSNLRDYIGRDPSKKTPYHIVLELDENVADLDKKFALIKLLDKIGSPVDLPDSNNVWPIHLAAQTNDERIVNFFIEKKVELNRADANGNTPLQYALFGKEITCPSNINPKDIIPDKPVENRDNNKSVIELTKLLTKDILDKFKNSAIIDISNVILSVLQNTTITEKYKETVQNQIVTLLADQKLKDSFREQQSKIEEIMTRVFADLRSNMIYDSTVQCDHAVKNNKYVIEFNSIDITKSQNIIIQQQSELIDIKKKINAITADPTDKEYFRVDDSKKFIIQQRQKLIAGLRLSIGSDAVKKYLFAKYFILLSTYYYLKFPIEVFSTIIITGTKIMTSDEFDAFIGSQRKYVNGIPPGLENKSIFSFESIDIIPDIDKMGYHGKLLSERIRVDKSILDSLSIRGANIQKTYNTRLLLGDVFFYDQSLKNIVDPIPILSTEFNKIGSPNNTFANLFTKLIQDFEFDAEKKVTFLGKNIDKSYLSIIFLLNRIIITSLTGRTPPINSYPYILSLNITDMYDQIDVIYEKSRFMGLQPTPHYQQALLLMKIVIQYLQFQITDIFTGYFRIIFNRYTEKEKDKSDGIYDLYNDTANNTKLDFALSTSILLGEDIDNNFYETLPEYKNMLNQISEANPLQLFFRELKSTSIINIFYKKIDSNVAKYFTTKYSGKAKNRDYDKINEWIDDVILNDIPDKDLTELYTNSKTTELNVHIESLINTMIKILEKSTSDRNTFDSVHNKLIKVDQNIETNKGFVTYQHLLTNIKFFNNLSNEIDRYMDILRQITIDINLHVNKNYDYHILEHLVPSFTIYNIKYIKLLSEYIDEYNKMREYTGITDIETNILSVVNDTDKFFTEFSIKIINMSNVYLSKLIGYLNLSSSYRFLHQLDYSNNPIDKINNLFNQFIEEIQLPIFDITNKSQLNEDIDTYRKNCRVDNYNYYLSPISYGSFNTDANKIYSRKIYTDININPTIPIASKSNINGEVFDLNLNRTIGSIGISINDYDRNSDQPVVSSIYDSIDYRLLLTKAYILIDITNDISKYNDELNKLFGMPTQSLVNIDLNKKALIGKLTDNIISQIILNIFIRSIGQLIKDIIRENNTNEFNKFVDLFKEVSVFKFKMTDVLDAYKAIPTPIKKYVSGYSTVIIHPNNSTKSGKINKDFIQYLYDMDFSTDTINQSARKKCIYIDHVVVNKLMTQVNTAKLDSNGNNILHYLVNTHNHELIKNIMNESSRINPLYLITSKNIRGQTPKTLASDNLFNHISFINNNGSFVEKYAVLIDPFVETLMKRLNNEKFGGNILKNTELIVPFTNLIYHHIHWNYLESFNYGTTTKQNKLITIDNFYSELYDDSAINSVLIDKNPMNIVSNDKSQINEKKSEDNEKKIKILENMIDQLNIGKSSETDIGLINMYNSIIAKHEKDLDKLLDEKSTLYKPSISGAKSNIFRKKFDPIIDNIKSDPNLKYNLMQIYKIIFETYDRKNNNIINGDVVRSAINNNIFTSSIDSAIILLFNLFQQRNTLEQNRNNTNEIKTVSKLNDNKNNFIIVSDYLETIVSRINLKYDLPQTISENPVIKEEYEIISFVLDKLLSGIVYEYLMQVFYKSLEVQSVSVQLNLDEIFTNLNQNKIHNLTLKEYIETLSKLYIRYTTHIYESNADPLQNTTNEGEIYNLIIDYFKINTKYNLIDSSPFVTELISTHLPFIGQTYRNVINSAMSSIYANEKYLTGLSIYTKDYISLL